MKENNQVPTDVALGSEFAKLRRRIRAYGRFGLDPRPEWMERCIEIDIWMTDHTHYWKSNFGYQKGTNAKKL